MSQIQYWHMQMFPTEVPDFSKYVPIILENKNFIGLGEWAEKKGQIEDFCNRMKIGDIVAIKKGKKLIALTEVVSNAYGDDGQHEQLSWIEHRRTVKIFDWAVNGEEIPQPRGTLNICANDDKVTTQIIKDWHKRVLDYFKELEISPR